MVDKRLFISHANEDSAVVKRIVEYLEARGVACWIAGRDIPPQAIYAEAITTAIQGCAACAVIVSAASNGSAAIKRELELASHHGRPFIPIRIDGTEPGPGFDYYLRNTQWIDYQREQERALDRIVTHLKTAGAAPSGAPALPQSAPSPRGGRMRVLLIAATLIAAAAGAWYVFARSGSPHITASVDAPPRATPPPSVQIDGTWNLRMTCASGYSLIEPEARFQNGTFNRSFGNEQVSGETRLRMASADAQSIHLNGEVAFASIGIFPVDAQGVTSDDGATFTGFGLFGVYRDCPFVAIRLP